MALPYRTEEQLRRLSIQELEELLDDANVNLLAIPYNKQAYVNAYISHMAPGARQSRAAPARPSRSARSASPRRPSYTTRPASPRRVSRPGRYSEADLQKMSVDQLVDFLENSGISTVNLSRRKPALISAYLNRMR